MLLDYNTVHKTSFRLSNVAYMGDDLPDLACMQAVRAAEGLTACSADAASKIKDICDFVSTKNGSNGANTEKLCGKYCLTNEFPVF